MSRDAISHFKTEMTYSISSVNGIGGSGVVYTAEMAKDPEFSAMHDRFVRGHKSKSKYYSELRDRLDSLMQGKSQEEMLQLLDKLNLRTNETLNMRLVQYAPTQVKQEIHEEQTRRLAEAIHTAMDDRGPGINLLLDAVVPFLASAGAGAVLLKRACPGMSKQDFVFSIVAAGAVSALVVLGAQQIKIELYKKRRYRQ